ncbi:MerR family transcriptional regulator [bacterium]|nr:MerR family transcriptional regulator [bacterium]
MQERQKFKLAELSRLVDISPRNIRYYIQLSLVDRPIGSTKQAYYTASHVEQLLKIKRWQDAGLTLEKIREIVADSSSEIPKPQRKVGSISVISHILIAPGIELLVDPSEVEVSTHQLRAVVKKIVEYFDDVTSEKSNDMLQDGGNNEE